MSNNNNNNSSENIGCLIILGLLFIGPILIELLNVLIPLAITGGITYAFFQLKKYDEKTGNITRAFEKTFQINQSSSKTLELPQNEDGHYGLPAGRNDEIISKLSDIDSKVTILKSENEEIKVSRDKDIQQALNMFSDEIKTENKKELLKQIYGSGTEAEQYQSSDEYEKKEFLEYYRKKKEELENREFKQDIEEKLFDQDQKIFEFRDEAKEDRFKIRQEMADGFAMIIEKLGLLEKDVITFKTYVSEKFSNLELTFFKEVENLRGMITGVHYELKQELSDTKLAFGQEILRVDRQQMSIIDKMRAYEHKVNAFSLEMRKVKVDAERFAMRGENMLEKAQIVYQKHKTDLQKTSNELGVALEKISLKEQGFANTVGAARVKMDYIAHQQYYALKDIAYEKVGVEMLRQDYDKRVQLQNEKVARLNEQKSHLLQQIKSENSHSKALGQLNHQLRMTQENLNHANNRQQILQQETAVFRRMNK